MTSAGTYAVTGSASGMGASVAAALRADGHTVIGVDQRDADVVADLSTPDGRRRAADEVLARSGGQVDGAVLAAGMGPAAGRERMIVEVNVFGVTELLTAWRPALAASEKAKVVVFGSNSTTVTPLVPKSAIRRLLAGDPEGPSGCDPTPARRHGPGGVRVVEDRGHAVVPLARDGDRMGR